MKKFKLKKLIVFAVVMAMMTVTVAGCSTTGDTSSSEGPISFVDDEGNQIDLDQPCTRVISLYSAHTENLFYLGAGDKIIGNYKTGIYPAAASEIETFDYNSDPEKVIAAEPDCVIIRPFITEKAPDFVEAIKSAGIPVVSLYPESKDDFESYITRLAMIVGAEDQAEEQLALLNSEISEIEDTVSAIPEDEKQTIFFEATEENVRTVTADSMAGQAIESAGGINIAADAEAIIDGSSIAVFGEEAVLEQADNIDVYVSQSGSMNGGGDVESIEARAGFDTIKAVKDGRVYTIDEKLISSPTFRQYKGVRELARFLYPDVMDDYSAYENDETATREDMAYVVVKAAHLPIWTTSSSKYYSKTTEGHIYGMFEDVDWQADDFDYIETATMSGAMNGYVEDEKEYFKPEDKVTREDLAIAVAALGDFTDSATTISISDLDACDNPETTQLVVDHGIMDLQDGAFNPTATVTNQEVVETINAALATIK